jgi:hypothetical protein
MPLPDDPVDARRVHPQRHRPGGRQPLWCCEGTTESGGPGHQTGGPSRGRGLKPLEAVPLAMQEWRPGQLDRFVGWLVSCGGQSVGGWATDKTRLTGGEWASRGSISHTIGPASSIVAATKRVETLVNVPDEIVGTHRIAGCVFQTGHYPTPSPVGQDREDA